MECIGNEVVIGYTMMCFKQDNREVVVNAALEGLKKLGSLLSDGRQFLTGSKPVIADFILFEHINFTQQATGGKTFETEPGLQAFYERMGNLPGLKEYLVSPAFAKVKDNFVPVPPAKVDMN